MNKKQGPWTITATKTIYKNPWIRVREDSVIRPDKKTGIFSVIEMKEGVSVLPIDKDNNVYITKEFKYAVNREMIEASSGGLEDGESVLEAAKRELNEEMGISAKEWIYLGYIDPFTSIVTSPNHMYIAKDLAFTSTNPEGTELISPVKISLNEAIQMVMKNKITHGATVAIILKTKNYFNL
jgi:ADP-ribose pyrophosphatase